MRITVDDGVALEVLEAGSGTALMLVHGFGGAKEDFSDHIDALATRYRVITFDHRGHGQSDAPDDASAYSLDRLAGDVLAVAGALGVDRFRLLGHSMGGMVARRVVLSDAGRVEALVLMDTSPGPVPGIDRDLVETAAIIGLEQGKDVLKPLLDEAATLDTPAHLRVLAQRPGYREFEERKWAALSVVMWATLVREVASQPDQLAALASVACPTLVIVGVEDRPFLEASRQIAATIPGAQLVVVPDAGHSPQFENPGAWLSALDDFLDAVDRAGASA